MSQVINAKDGLEESRKNSAAQESEIKIKVKQDRGLSDATKKDPITLVLGIAALPIWAFWSFMGGLGFLASLLLRGFLKVAGKIFGGESFWNKPYSKK
jgi:hypothetical protein